MIVSPFRISDLMQIELQPAQRNVLNGFEVNTRIYENTFTARVDGRIIAIAGVMRAERDVGLVWALISRHAGRHFWALHRAAERLFEVAGFARLIALTEVNFFAGCRWLELLKFTRDEEPLLGADGEVRLVYTRAMQ